MDSRPIGVFDSGIGGLTAFRQLKKLLPNEDIIYFGDTGRVPYGSHGRETIVKYSTQDIRFLLSHDVKLIVAACGTASANLDTAFISRLTVPFVEVITPSVQTACAVSTGGLIGVIGTRASIQSKAYGKAVRTIRPEFKVFGRPCPLFVPLVEEGRCSADDPVVRLVAEEYLLPLKNEGIDTLILGCTHYPLLTDVIGNIMGENVTLIDPGYEAASQTAAFVTESGIGNSASHMPRYRFFVSDSIDGFTQNAKNFLGESETLDVKYVDLDGLPDD